MFAAVPCARLPLPVQCKRGSRDTADGPAAASLRYCGVGHYHARAGANWSGVGPDGCSERQEQDLRSNGGLPSTRTSR